MKHGLLNPKAAAADLQAISVSAAKQAGEVMTTVAGKVETDMAALHDQILGGKRNLPDHARKLLESNPETPAQHTFALS